MKTMYQSIALALLAIFLAPSCSVGGHGVIEGEKKILVRQDTGAKGGYETVEETVKITHHCVKCGSNFCPKPDCCGIVNKEVLSRATGQSGTGEPPIGLIPTMKTLAPPLKK